MEPLNLLSFMNGGGSGSGGGFAGGAASLFSLAGAGFSFLGATQQAASAKIAAQGQANADIFQSEKADVAAQYGELQATQVGAQMTRNLNTTLGNIDAIRAAAHTDPSSPTGAAVRGQEETIGTEEKTIKVGNILAQTQQDEADAAYYRTAASNALLAGQVGATGAIEGGVGNLVGSFAKAIPGALSLAAL